MSKRIVRKAHRTVLSAAMEYMRELTTPHLDATARGKLLNQMRGCMPFHVDAVARYMCDSPQVEWDVSSLPSLRLPFPMCWFEYRMPKTMNLGGNVSSTGYEGTGVGVLLAEAEKPVSRTASMVKRLLSSPECARLAEGANEFRVVSHNEFLQHKGKLICSPAIHLHLLKPDGAYVGHVVFGLKALVDGMAAANQSIGFHVYPALWAIGMLHCKNVHAVRESQPAEALYGATQNRRNRRDFIQFYTLEIAPLAAKAREYGGGAKGMAKAIHICRGHFKDYREKGLFGQASHKGVYWWQPHVRGDEKQGIVEKDYAVSTKKEGS